MCKLMSLGGTSNPVSAYRAAGPVPFFSVPLDLSRDRCLGVPLHVVYCIRSVSSSYFPFLTGPKSQLKSSVCPCSPAVFTTLHICVAHY